MRDARDISLRRRSPTALSDGALRRRSPTALSDGVLPQTPARCGPKLHVRELGRPIAALPNPFAILVELLDLGVELASIGSDAVAIFRTPA